MQRVRYTDWENPFVQVTLSFGRGTWAAAAAAAVVAADVVDAVALHNRHSLLQNFVVPTVRLEFVGIHRRGTVQTDLDQASFLAFRQTSSLVASGIGTSWLASPVAFLSSSTY